MSHLCPYCEDRCYCDMEDAEMELEDSDDCDHDCGEQYDLIFDEE